MLCFAAALVACDEDDPSEAGGGGSAAGARFFLPTGEPDNTSAPTIEVDREGGIHAVYPAYAGGGAYCSYCAKGCSGPEQAKVVRFDTQGTVGNAMLALDADGRPHVLLSAYQKVYYASCQGDCTAPSSWTTTEILDHGGDRDVTGEAFALDPEGRPRFLMHTYVAFLGIGQKPPATFYVACDVDCHSAESWKVSKISPQIWQRSTLRFDRAGHPHVATVAIAEKEGGGTWDLGAYATCSSACDTEDGWHVQGLYEAYSSEYEAVPMKPAISMELTKAGMPRVLLLGKDQAGKRNILYFQCDADCTTESGWVGSIISNHERIAPGIDLALDANDHPRFVYTLDYNIALAWCDADDCVSEGAKWDLKRVEASSDIPRDPIFLWGDCNVAAWFLHDPSIALDPSGLPRVGYQALDISGGGDPTNDNDPNDPGCEAGTDMTWSRLAVLTSL